MGSPVEVQDMRVADEPERLVQREPQVLEGDDDLPRQPTARRDPFVPEPGPTAGDRRAFRALRLAFVPILIVVAVLVFAALR